MSYSYHPEILAAQVRAYRDREKLSLRDLAERAQVSTATLSRIENQVAKLGPDTETLVRVANACGIHLEEILQSDNSEEQSHIQDISTQLRASKQVSSATMQALEAMVRAIRLQSLSDEIN